MRQKKRIYPSENLGKINGGVLNTASKELYERILKEYPERIFSGQIIEYFDFHEKKNYLIGGLNFLKLKAFLKGREEQYELFERDGNKIYFIYGQDRNTKWFSC